MGALPGLAFPDLEAVDWTLEPGQSALEFLAH